MFPEEPLVVQMVYNTLNQALMGIHWQMLVRLHPLDTFERYQAMRTLPNIHFDVPGKNIRGVDDREFDFQQMTHLANTLCHSDVVINIASTITIEAAIFDTPIVNICFDARDDLPEERSVRRCYTFSHYKAIVESGGVKIARNVEELGRYVREYLIKPSLDKAGRRRIVQEQCGQLDGKAGQRIAQVILEIINAKDKRAGIHRQAPGG